MRTRPRSPEVYPFFRKPEKEKDEVVIFWTLGIAAVVALLALVSIVATIISNM